MKKIISCILLCGIVLGSSVSAHAVTGLDTSYDCSTENISENMDMTPRDLEGKISQYLYYANSTPVELMTYTNVEADTTMRVRFDETQGPTTVLVTVQQKIPGTSYFQSIPGGSKTMTVGGPSLTVVNISPNVNTQVRIMLQWISGSSGKVTFDIEFT